jgi:hypothetical protein
MMKTQCCRPPYGSPRCQDCPLTVPNYQFVDSGVELGKLRAALKEALDRWEELGKELEIGYDREINCKRIAELRREFWIS